ncbi:tRNA nuclease WapA [Pandoraea captiosa]|uniref:tRNA nuclease WapA n=1 Tax=Pandoraea captiosa TaxID=2508302 RepID=A0A5E4ZQG6_9BURK|nr:RHS repeat-associated core domain-containing protein [Pandoraea captiosa]VVE62493.1 tRNA nuclease WapA [Pandoraea captiosa]
MTTRRTSLHAHTPSVTAVDARGATTRGIDYLRSAEDELTPLITRNYLSTGQRLTSQQDPRLGALALTSGKRPTLRSGAVQNQTTLHSLSGEVLRTESVDAGWQVALIDVAGLPRLGWDARGTHQRFEYDALARPTAIFEGARDEVSERCTERMAYAGPDAFDANACAQRIRHDDPAGSLRREAFDLNGQPLTETRRFLNEVDSPDWPEDESERETWLEAIEWTTTWHADALGEVWRQTDACGNTTSQRVDVAGALETATLLQAGKRSEQIVVRDMIYDAMGHLCAQTAGNGVTSEFVYRATDGRLIGQHARKADGSTVQALLYEYDPVGNVVRIEDLTVAPRFHRNRRTDGVSLYTYDTMSRLVEATGRESAQPSQGPELPTPGDETLLVPYVRQYTYDHGGNLTRMLHTGDRPFTSEMVVAATSNRALRKDDVTPPDFDKAFDENGNMQTLAPGQSMIWTARNELRRVTQIARDDAVDDDECYQYDAGGRRIRKVTRRVAQRVTHLAEVRYLPGLEIRTDTATGEVLHVIAVPGGASSVRLLHWNEGLPEGIDNDSVRFRLDDRLGSNVCELDADANITSREGYYPFGSTAWQASRHTVEVKYRVLRYAGRERDATGLYYYGYRYLAPWLHRWITPDPAGDVDGLNLFAMVGNNPMTLTDWQGLAAEEPNRSHIGGTFASLAFAALLFLVAGYFWFTSKARKARKAVSQLAPGRRASASPKGKPPSANLRQRVNSQSPQSNMPHATVDTPPSGNHRRQSSASSIGSFHRGGMRASNISILSQASASPSESNFSSGMAVSTAEKEEQERKATERAAKKKASGASAAKKAKEKVVPIAQRAAARPVAPERAPVPEEKWTIVKSERYTAMRNDFALSRIMTASLDESEERLKNGETPGDNEHAQGVLPGYTSYWSADVRDGQGGRGVWRLIYTRNVAEKKVFIHGVGDYHVSKGRGMEQIKWF